jgi:CRP/FNR family cyclic AMP-dependent transcriptional regulator
MQGALRMGLNDIVAALADCAIFGRIDARRLRVVALAGETLRFRSGEVLFRVGDDGEAAFVVISGQAEVLAPTPNDDKAIAVLGRGEVFGEIAALSDRPRTATVRAHGELVVLRLPSATLKRLLAEFPDIALTLIAVIGARLEAANRKLAEAGA